MTKVKQFEPRAQVAAPLRTPTDLSRDALNTVSAALNAILADSFALYLKTKNFHWHVSGPAPSSRRAWQTERLPRPSVELSILQAYVHHPSPIFLMRTDQKVKGSLWQIYYTDQSTLARLGQDHRRAGAAHVTRHQEARLRVHLDDGRLRSHQAADPTSLSGSSTAIPPTRASLRRERNNATLGLCS